jgi:hypothetical protein
MFHRCNISADNVARVHIRSATLIGGLGGRDAIAFDPSTAKSKLPGMNQTYLTQDERYQIAILLNAGHDRSGRYCCVLKIDQVGKIRRLRENRMEPCRPEPRQ